jgi:hypothetical protein
MMRVAALIAASLALLASEGRGADANKRNPIPDDCPVTLPAGQEFSPPTSDANALFAEGFWHGDGRLAVYLESDGRLHAFKQRQEMTWYTAGYAWQNYPSEAPLRITGRRLDSASKAAPHIEGMNNAELTKGLSGMRHFIEIPERGCWRIDADFEGDYVSFVVWVD